MGRTIRHGEETGIVGGGGVTEGIHALAQGKPQIVEKQDMGKVNHADTMVGRLTLYEGGDE